MPVGHQRLLVFVGDVETEAEPTPALGRAPMTTGNPIEHARTEEGVEVTLTTIPPGMRLGLHRIQPSRGDPDGRLLLAMLQRKGACWVVTPIPRRTRGPSAKANLKKDKRKRT